ncbi:uncharacterized protein [Physcomitrium patens]|uniref:Uncharacterized protein n=1 Tax=Physcomitrium patens TaxID=3218 RepID=A0A2K1KXF8_PHYPA|nr:uncharacterized protein LOC112279778 isoform X2 [Physcomitrium patens]PNR58474.1 hypothetical protein PHYPA_005469 [Physcomitrium patens]|eukprot:XP_024370217.1 uncharacterized protein LOC112279778 isoform X2 [Physcomitrella patens]
MRRSILRRQMRQRSPFTRTISSIHYPAMQQKEGAVSAPNSLSSASLTLRLTKFLGFPDIWSFSSEDLRGRSSPGRSRGGDRGGSYGGGGGSYGIGRSGGYGRGLGVGRASSGNKSWQRRGVTITKAPLVKMDL